MDKAELIFALHGKLCRVIRYHSRLYYVESTQEIQDDEWDNMLERLEELEAKYPMLMTPDSPTQLVDSGVCLDDNGHWRPGCEDRQYA